MYRFCPPPPRYAPLYSVILWIENRSVCLQIAKWPLAWGRVLSFFLGLLIAPHCAGNIYTHNGFKYEVFSEKVMQLQARVTCGTARVLWVSSSVEIQWLAAKVSNLSLIHI